MPYTISFIGIDGAGKTTLINKLKLRLEFPVSHQNYYMKHFYSHQHSRLWEWLNLGELICRNIWWRFFIKTTSLIMDRCYICSLVYSQLEGYPDIALHIKRWAVHPDLMVLFEPYEEFIPNANRFIIKYRETLKQEGYEMFNFAKAYKGQISFWKCPEISSFYLRYFTEIIGSLA